MDSIVIDLYDHDPMSPENFQYCRYEVDGAVLTITLDRPEVLNSMTPEAHFELDAAFNLYRDDASLLVAIITGAGDRAFCVGTGRGAQG